MNIGRSVLVICAAFVLSLFFPPLYALEDKTPKQTIPSKVNEQLLGIWEIDRTKEPGKPYTQGYKGRPFVSKGANAFTLVLEYRTDGTFRRITRLGEKETVQEGKWILSGHELRHRRQGAKHEEVMYVRFDGPDRYTSLEVFEETADPGLFAQFKRLR